jgi:hypothetical protein
MIYWRYGYERSVPWELCKDLKVFFNSLTGGWIPTGSTRHGGHWLPFIPAPVDYDDGEFGGMNIGRENRSTRRKPAPAPLCPPQISLDRIRDRTQAAAVGNQQLTAWAMARPNSKVTYVNYKQPVDQCSEVFYYYKNETLLTEFLKTFILFSCKSIAFWIVFI